MTVLEGFAITGIVVVLLGWLCKEEMIQLDNEDTNGDK